MKMLADRCHVLGSMKSLKTKHGGKFWQVKRLALEASEHLEK